MRKSLSFLLLLAAVPGCGDPNAGALFADIQYATRCEETLGCAGDQDRDICGIHLSDPCGASPDSPSLSCTVTESDASRVVSFSATQGDFAFSVQQVVVPFAGGSASGASCRVRVTDGENTYEGMCGSNTPSESQPCQITNVRFYDNEGNAELDGEIFCQFLPNRAQPGLHIELTAPGNGPTPASTPAMFRMANCSGLTLP